MRPADRPPVLDILSLLQRRLAGASLIAFVDIPTVAAGRAARAQLEV
jgi:hypothetical protein